MKAMVMNKVCNVHDDHHPLDLVDLPKPVPEKGEILLKVSACGVCHTELDEIEGRTPPDAYPVVPGHQVVGRVEAMGPGTGRFGINDRVGVGWIYSACRACTCCDSGLENLCDAFAATGRDADGGYAEFMTVPEAFAYRIPDIFTDVQAAPLLCAGAIGYRSMMLCGMKNTGNLGLTGFGASAHLVLKMIRFQYEKVKVFVFARNEKERAFALELGAVWSGDIDEKPPELMDWIIDTTPVWKPVVTALENLKPGGRLVINAIRKEEIDKDYLLRLDYPGHLWMEKEIKSVANVARKDIADFLTLATRIPILPEVRTFPLESANQALVELRQGKIRGAKVLVMGDT